MVVGTGVGFIFQPMLVALQAHVPQARRAVITSNRNFFRCAGGAVGLAVSAAVLQATLRKRLPPAYASLAHSTYTVPDLAAIPAADAAAILDAYMAASHAVFILLIPLIGVCFLGCVLIRDHGLQYRDPTQPAAAEPVETSSVPTPQVMVLDSASSTNVEVDTEKKAERSQ